MSIHPFHQRASNQPMSAVSWAQSLDQARSERDVVAAVRDFIASLGPADVARLPAPCRPGKFVDADDVTSFALEVVRYDCAREDAGTRELVHRLAAFFSQASTRLSQLLARSNDQDEEALRSA